MSEERKPAFWVVKFRDGGYFAGRRCCRIEEHAPCNGGREMKCGIPANGGALGFACCDLEYGHDEDMHANSGDGFYSRSYENEHAYRQQIMRIVRASVLLHKWKKAPLPKMAGTAIALEAWIEEAIMDFLGEEGTS